MGGLEIIFILLVPLAVWIFSSIFKGDDDRQGNRPATARPSPQSRPVTDLERFLEEARRRREAADRRGQPSGEAPPRPAPQPRPGPPPQERRPARPQPAQLRRPGPAPAPTPARRPVILQPVPEPPTSYQQPRADAQRVESARVEAQRVEEQRVESARVETLIPVVPVAVPVPAVPPLAPRLPILQVAGTRTPAQPPALAHLAALLKTSRSAATAIVLREIFDEPLCRRRRPN